MIFLSLHLVLSHFCFIIIIFINNESQKIFRTSASTITGLFRINYHINCSYKKVHNKLGCYLEPKQAKFFKSVSWPCCDESIDMIRQYSTAAFPIVGYVKMFLKLREEVLGEATSLFDSQHTAQLN